MESAARLVPCFGGDAYGPGDIVEGVLVSREPMDRVRTLIAFALRLPDDAYPN